MIKTKKVKQTLGWMIILAWTVQAPVASASLKRALSEILSEKKAEK